MSYYTSNKIFFSYLLYNKKKPSIPQVIIYCKFKNYFAKFKKRSLDIGLFIIVTYNFFFFC